MTTQEAYETIRAWLTRPGAERAIDPDSGSCEYITAAGNKCAVGCLLTEETLGRREIVSCGSVTGLIDTINPPELAGIDADFLYKAQAAHDYWRNWSDGKFDVDALDQYAIDFGLEPVTS